MKIAVRYYTKGGNTKRLAEAVAKAVGVEALPVSTPVNESVDILYESDMKAAADFARKIVGIY